VLAGPTVDYDHLPELLQTEWVDVLGLSVADDRDIRGIQQTISNCRLQSRNHALRVMVGGPQAFLRPHLAAETGADGATTHAGQAQATALAWVRQLQR
jgi:hypothetical protein